MFYSTKANKGTIGTAKHIVYLGTGSRQSSVSRPGTFNSRKNYRRPERSTGVQKGLQVYRKDYRCIERSTGVQIGLQVYR